jgi:hypothetical protein
MHCPICHGAADDLTPRIYAGLVISCARCGVFRVTKNAVLAIARLEPERRLAALDKAKLYTSPRAWPTISNACV